MPNVKKAELKKSNGKKGTKIFNFSTKYERKKSSIVGQLLELIRA
jgi:hypothetical protein